MFNLINWCLITVYLTHLPMPVMVSVGLAPVHRHALSPSNSSHLSVGAMSARYGIHTTIKNKALWLAISSKGNNFFV